MVFRNHLIELIQYAPGAKVQPEPVLIVPAWIMKYYILDLSPHNSLVKYLTGQGFTVFMISWRNPDPEIAISASKIIAARRNGALDAVNEIMPDRKVHAVGYCLGGTLLVDRGRSHGARQRRAVRKTLTLLAAQADFTRGR